MSRTERTPINATLIDPFLRRVGEVTVTPEFSHFYQVMSQPGFTKVSCIQPVELPANHVLYLDENTCFFKDIPTFELAGHLFSGKALVVGEHRDEEGNSRFFTPHFPIVHSIVHGVRWSELVTNGSGSFLVL